MACLHKADQKDRVPIDTADCTADGPIYVPGTRLELNAKVAATLASPILMALDAKVDEPSDLASRALICKNTFEQSHARVLGLVLNQACD